MPDFICEVCEVKFATQKDLDKHIEKQHPEMKPDAGAAPKGT